MRTTCWGQYHEHVLARARLVVQVGPDTGADLEFGEAPVILGRGSDADLQLSDAAVSRRHMTVCATPSGAARIVALTGVNPVWTLDQGRRRNLAAGDELPLGAALMMGSTTLVVSRPADQASVTGVLPGRATVELAVDRPPTPGDRLAELATLGDQLARASSLDEALTTATRWCLSAVPAHRALLLSPDGRDVLAGSTADPAPDLALSRTLIARVREQRTALWVRDVSVDPDLANRRSVQVHGLSGAMAAPARHLVLYCDWRRSDPQPDAHALNLLVCAANLLSALGEAARERSHLRGEVRSKTPLSHGTRMVGDSAAMQRLEVFIDRVAPRPSTVLLFGESGTGKELAARAIHLRSPRASAPFVAINCAAIPEQLQESELFGHERGAFTGAVSRHAGVFERADGGTLFLDEIGEMSLSTQARMLRVLEARRFVPVGATEEREVDVRLVAATHRDLEAMVAEGSFRQDLLYRLNVIRTELPPLRARSEDIPVLVAHFARTLGEDMGRRIDHIAPDALEVLQRYTWPGNVRELRNVVERALVLGDGAALELDDLPPELALARGETPTRPTSIRGARAPVHANTVRTLAEVEREAIDLALAATDGNKARAAALLGIDRSTLYRKLKD